VILAVVEYLKKIQIVENPAKTQTSIRLASRLVRTPDLEDMSLNPLFTRELGAMTKSGKTFGVRSFYIGDPDMIT
jgi:hypothetical protein